MGKKGDLYPMLTVEEAAERFLSHFKPLELETVLIQEALNRVLAEDIAAPMDIPPLANTAMDGYALRSADTAAAGKETPVRLKVAANLAAGYTLEETILPGTAVRIMTGAPIPAGADAVAPFEDTQAEGEEVLIFKSYKPGKHVRAAGEDVHAGDKVLTSGKILRPQEIGMLAALGSARVKVHRSPRVGILSTGDEIIEVEAPWAPGKIRDSNSYTIASLVQKYGGVPVRLGIAHDNLQELIERIRQGLAQKVDLFITSGGVSVGDFDVVKEALTIEGEISFWRVKMKPGKPLAFGMIKGTPFLGLPGNPVSSMVSFELFARPALLKMEGKTRLKKASLMATLVDGIPAKDERRHYVRVRLEAKEGRILAHLTGDQGSGILRSLVDADGLAIIPEGLTSWAAGQVVQVLLLDGEELVE
jgi:molybdopterin molybdotransferase